MNRSELIQQIHQKENYLCIGLDTDAAKLPPHLKDKPDAVFQFNKAIIDATKGFCVSYKINTAFYEARGVKGWEAMEQTVQYIPSTHFKIADAKRGDIGNTSAQYAKTFFETLPFDAVTINPYMGEDSVRPFLEYNNKFAIVLGLTSNEGAHDFELLHVCHTRKKQEVHAEIGKHHLKVYTEELEEEEQAKDEPLRYLYEMVLEKVSSWGTPDNLMFVAGATRTPELAAIRRIVPDNFLLVPGVGAQGGSLKEVSEHGLNKDVGLLVNVSRAVIYASAGEDFAAQAGIAAKGYSEKMQSFVAHR
ncbi:orotidine-5'-phosphate decarboxylase [Ilyomonas limi]|jgi:orotidine-5'-phosphate decarboxylase|uniref:Orotidine-5'-phosphate decarboxylase n=1 Tax=Ilyomonas limi TaxID=2575867 RepID=A0A4U3KTH9_9BACT|nr:orotidine-5'-phosphate decarboxylase [Ilyomonas limi]TKK65651.1 orotidine-5'-phosphate decarboxylase [Ilyomonas limi]